MIISVNTLLLIQCTHKHIYIAIHTYAYANIYIFLMYNCSSNDPFILTVKDVCFFANKTLSDSNNSIESFIHSFFQYSLRR